MLIAFVGLTSCGAPSDLKCLNGRCLGDDVSIRVGSKSGYIHGFSNASDDHNDRYLIKYIGRNNGERTDYYYEHELKFITPKHSEGEVKTKDKESSGGMYIKER